MNYSNPVPNFKFKPGDTPYYVAIELDGWIPISVIVFANSEHHATEIVRNAVKFILERKSKMTPDDAPKLLTNKAKISVSKIRKNQLYRVGWAINDTILNQ